MTGTGCTCSPACTGVSRYCSDSNATCNTSSKSCECNSGYEKFNGTCVRKCDSDKTRNSSGSCVCRTGYTTQTDGSCCPNATPHKVNGTCQKCSAGQVECNGVCVSGSTCPPPPTCTPTVTNVCSNDCGLSQRTQTETCTDDTNTSCVGGTTCSGYTLKTKVCPATTTCPCNTSM